MQAWAEAMVIYKNCPHELKLSKAMEEYLKEIQKQFMPEDTKVGIIQAWLDGCTDEYVCSEMIYRKALRHEYEEPKRWEINEINDIMNTCIEGWEKVNSHRFDKGYGRQRGWKRKSDGGEFSSIPQDVQTPFE